MKVNKYLRLFLILTNDLTILFLTLLFAYLLRTESFINPFNILNTILISALIYLLFFFIFKIHQQYFRYFNFRSNRLYLLFYLIYTLSFIFYAYIQNSEFLPRSLVIIFPLFFFITILINRIIISKLFEFKFNINFQKILLIGFNENSQQLINQFPNIIFIIDDKIQNKKRYINGIKIINSKNLIKNINAIQFDRILINDPLIFEKIKYSIRETIFKKKILVNIIDLKNNEIIHKPYFDFNYFFDRKSKVAALDNIYDNKSIVITGAGGSIGSNIVFQLLKLNFKKLFLIDNSEYNLYKLTNFFEDDSKKISFILKSFEDQQFFDQFFLKNKIDIVIHAAAYKHVPLIEFNPFSAIKNNFIDTFNFMKIVSKHNIQYFSLISSDKAVRPTNFMGASKRLAEIALLYFNKKKENHTIFNAVRFGNVINSSGSVVPLFNSQINSKHSLTLTHENIIRYFMTIEEAANLVLSVCKISQGGEIFLLNMGDPIKILDLAKYIIQFSGKKIIGKDNIGDIKIDIIGLRKGEKLFEELLIDSTSKKTLLENIYQSIEKDISIEEFNLLYENIINSYENNDLDLLIKTISHKSVSFKNDKK